MPEMQRSRRLDCGFDREGGVWSLGDQACLVKGSYDMNFILIIPMEGPSPDFGSFLNINSKSVGSVGTLSPPVKRPLCRIHHSTLPICITHARYV